MLLSREQIRLIIIDIVSAALNRLHPQAKTTQQQLFDDELIDSLTQYQLATEVAVFFCLHDSNSETQLLEAFNLSAWENVVARHLGGADHKLCFSTSGSTGPAKQVVHKTTDLVAEATFWAQTLGSVNHFYRAIPCHHLYGFIFTVLLPEQFGKSAIDLRANMPRSYMPKLACDDVLITSPEVMRLWLHSPITLENGPTVVTSAAPASVEMSKALLDTGIKRHLHIYGSTETAGVGWRENLQSKYQLLPDIDEQLQRRGKALDLQDRLAFDQQGRFEVQKRLDNAIQISGYNVIVANVQEKLKCLPGVAEVAVRPVDGPMGKYLKALFVLRSDATELELKEALGQLPQYERPAQWKTTTELPKNELGKVVDWQ